MEDSLDRLVATACPLCERLFFIDKDWPEEEIIYCPYCGAELLP